MHSILLEFPAFRLGHITLGPVQIHAYGTMLAIAFIVALLGTRALARRLGTVEPELLIDITLCILVSGVVGARLLYVALHWTEHYSQHPVEILYIWEGGLAFHGGVFGALIAGLLCAKFMGIRFGALADVVAPFASLGYSITKIGCFLNGCCHGRPAPGLPWACQFPVNPGDTRILTPPSHPAQIYDALLNVGVFAVLMRLATRRRWNGQVFAWWILVYSVTRIIIEYFRYYPDNPAFSGAEALPGLGHIPVIGGVTQAQYLSLAVVMGAAALLWACRRCTLEDNPVRKAVPAFALGTLPATVFFAGWLAHVSATPDARNAQIIRGVAYVAVTLAVALLGARFPERSSEPPPASPAAEPPPAEGLEDEGTADPPPAPSAAPEDPPAPESTETPPAAAG